MSGGESLALAASTCFGPTERKRTWRAYICRTHGGNFLMMESSLLESLLRLDPNTMLLSASDMSYPHRQTDRQKEFKSFSLKVFVVKFVFLLCWDFSALDSSHRNDKLQLREKRLQSREKFLIFIHSDIPTARRSKKFLSAQTNRTTVVDWWTWAKLLSLWETIRKDLNSKPSTSNCQQVPTLQFQQCDEEYNMQLPSNKHHRTNNLIARFFLQAPRGQQVEQCRLQMLQMFVLDVCHFCHNQAGLLPPVSHSVPSANPHPPLHYIITTKKIIRHQFFLCTKFLINFHQFGKKISMQGKKVEVFGPLKDSWTWIEESLNNKNNKRNRALLLDSVVKNLHCSSSSLNLYHIFPQFRFNCNNVFFRICKQYSLYPDSFPMWYRREKK